MKNLYTKLNYIDEASFKAALSKKNNYSLSEIKNKLKIEILWNELIYMRYGKQVKIDKDSLIKKIDSYKDKTLNEYLLSEIFLSINSSSLSNEKGYLFSMY